MLVESMKITEFIVRDLAEFECFDRVRKLLKKERHYNNFRRKYPKSAKELGEQYLKVPELNKKAYVCINHDFKIQGYIEGQSEVSSPPLSMPSSAKPSALKLKQFKKSYGKSSCR